MAKNSEERVQKGSSTSRNGKADQEVEREHESLPVRREYSPTERRMLAVLADGMPHSRKELHACLLDDMGALSNIQPHIKSLRPKLQRKGQFIVCELYNGSPHYRQVRLLINPNRE